MYAIYQPGDLQKVEAYLSAPSEHSDSPIDPNLGGEWSVDMDEVMGYNNSLVLEDDQGLYWHIFDGGSLLTLAMIARHARRLDMIQLLLRYGARVNKRELYGSLSDVEVCKLVIGKNDVLSAKMILYAFRRAPLEVIRYLYECGNRLTRSDRDEVMTIVQKRVEEGNEDREWLDWAVRFTKRVV